MDSDMETKKQALIKDILAAEWDMFQRVRNIGGQRASCQEDHKTFDIMRSSQFKSWTKDALESYLNDLGEAIKDDRNLLTEKYARMMESTSPHEFAKLKHLLPPINPDVPELIEKILEIVLKWESELVQKYPNVTKRGRVLESFDDSLLKTSKMTYLKGELLTYSLKTLRLYYNSLINMESQNINGSKVIIEETVKNYGYSSIEHANKVLD